MLLPPVEILDSPHTTYFFVRQQARDPLSDPDRDRLPTNMKRHAPVSFITNPPFHTRTFFHRPDIVTALRRPITSTMQPHEQHGEKPSSVTSSPSAMPLPDGDPRTLHAYTPAAYLSRIRSFAPASRLHLAMRPTPIQPFALPESVLDADTLRARGISMLVKRDDMTHCAASGNKIRKLEFLLGDAVQRGTTAVLTAGGVQSNHARTVAVLCRSLGLTPHVFLRSADARRADASDVPDDGNVLLHKLAGSTIHLVPKMPYVTGLLPRMEALQRRIERQGKDKAYIIGIGGSNELGVWGYIDAYSELMTQHANHGFSHICLATGSGGTAAGLAIANYLNGMKVKIVAFTVSDDAAYFYNHVDEMLAHFGLHALTTARDIITIVENKGRGYGVNSDDDMRKCVQIANETGIVLDPTYTLKGVLGMVKEIEKGSGAGESVFEDGSKLLFLHTGGLFGVFDRRIEPHLDKSLVTEWHDDEQEDGQ